MEGYLMIWLAKEIVAFWIVFGSVWLVACLLIRFALRVIKP